MKRLRTCFAALLLLLGCSAASKSSFVQVKDGRLWHHNKPYYFVGANLWYGAILGSTGKGGNRRRLGLELDRLKRMGINNLRVLVGSDGEEGVTAKVTPTLQRAPGVYNDSVLDGLDYLLQEMERRGMLAVLYLNNSWEWSGGYGYYLEQAGAGKAVQPAIVGYQNYVRYSAQFASNERAQQLFFNYVRFILTRKNRYTGRRYRDEPSIMSWQIGNEPRAFSREALPAFEAWLRRASSLIRSLDKNHLISIGSEGEVGCEMDIDCWRRICSDPNVDYTNIHIWPANWGWAHRDSLGVHLRRAITYTHDYIARHLAISEALHKPMVLEEFGYPRDGYAFSPKATTRNRDAYYAFLFEDFLKNVREDGCFSGCNFWAWGGDTVAKHEQWQPGDPYMGDPAQEPQGLYSVFLSDRSTCNIIQNIIKKLPN
jgi:beta-mannosidase